MVIDFEAIVMSLLIAGIVFCWTRWLYRKPAPKEAARAVAEVPSEPVALAAASD
jgi:hypothetical protein